MSDGTALAAQSAAMTRRTATSTLLASLALAGCMGDGAEVERDDYIDDGVGAFTSDQAVLVDFAFDGELTTAAYGNWRTQIKSQLMYTVGQLNGEPGVARLDKVVTTNL